MMIGKHLLDDANVVEYTLQETKHPRHAKEVVQSLDLSKYDGIFCVSGDGILVKVLNELLVREDWDNAIRIPLGVVPAGTGNVMVKLMTELNTGSHVKSPYMSFLKVKAFILEHGSQNYDPTKGAITDHRCEEEI